MKKMTYTIQVFCSNCLWTGERNIPAGITIEDFLGPGHQCPCCKCATLRERPYIVRYTIDPEIK